MSSRAASYSNRGSTLAQCSQLQLAVVQVISGQQLEANGEWLAADATVSQTLSSHFGRQLAVASSGAPSHTLESAERPYDLHACLPMVLMGPDPCPRWSRTVLGQDFISDLLKFCQKCVMPVGHASAIRQTHLRCHMHS